MYYSIYSNNTLFENELFIERDKSVYKPHNKVVKYMSLNYFYDELKMGKGINFAGEGGGRRHSKNERYGFKTAPTRIYAGNYFTILWGVIVLTRSEFYKQHIHPIPA